MIKYRPHRGGLDESMKEAQEFAIVDEMKKYICEYHRQINDGLSPFAIVDIIIGEPLGDDARIGWNGVRHVCVKRYFTETYSTPQCIGWCSIGG